jgi:hypothetical protein
MGEVKLKLEKLKAEMEDFTAKAQRSLRNAKEEERVKLK